jgi:hypothetical protein
MTDSEMALVVRHTVMQGILKCVNYVSYSILATIANYHNLESL